MMNTTKKSARFLLWRIGCILLCCIAIFAWYHFYTNQQISDAEENLSLQAVSSDGEIVVKWNLPSSAQWDEIEIFVYSDDELVEQLREDPQLQSVSFTNGSHGLLYRIEANAHSQLIGWRAVGQDEAMFLDYSLLPELPIIEIQTVTGTEPTYSIAEKPAENAVGESITDNEYLAGEFTLFDHNEVMNINNIKIRVRGNTSAVGRGKKPYKIRLSRAADLLGLGEEYAKQDWVLLNFGTTLNTYLGDYLASLCGMEWQNQMCYVNVMLNGDWKGTYILTPAVSYESANGLVGKDGYIFEYDAYWWKDETVYFQLENQPENMGYTFRYPEVTSASDHRVDNLKKYMQEAQDLVLAGDDSYTEYLDVDTFSHALLVRDILGNGDEAGSNYYFYKNSSTKSQNSKVKAGPLWDFDAAFTKAGQWSTIHTTGAFYFNQLYWSDPFYEAYIAKWKEISPTLLSSVTEELAKLSAEQGQALNESWMLDAERWRADIIQYGQTQKSFSTQKQAAIEWFEERIAWMNTQLYYSDINVEAIDITGYDIVQGSLNCSIDFERVREGKHILKGWTYRLDGGHGQTGVLSGNTVYLATTKARSDVKEYYSLAFDEVGFEIICDYTDDWRICIVDSDTRTVYVWE